MISTRPAVQSIRNSDLHITYEGKAKRDDKRNANRRHRRYLNAATRSFVYDEELFYDESFSAPSLSTWDID